VPWLKSGDNAATYPKVMQIAGFRGVDPDVVVNEVFGWLTRCMLQGAGHMTDYHVDVGTAYMLGGRRTDDLVRLCRRAGLLSEVKLDGVRAFKLIEDPEFMHMRLKAEVEAERQRQRDNANPALVVPVTLRDGDNCRWCGVLTQWRGKTSARTRTLDHLEGVGTPATVETLVVACMGCNSARQDNPRWSDDHPLRPPPQHPLYSRWAADYLNKNGYPEITENVENRTTQRPAPAPGADTAPTGVRPATGQDDDPAAAPNSTSKSLPSPIRTGKPGSGRDGFGPGSGGEGKGQVGIPPPARRRRGRRGGRRSDPPARGES